MPFLAHRLAVVLSRSHDDGTRTDRGRHRRAHPPTDRSTTRACWMLTVAASRQPLRLQSTTSRCVGGINGSQWHGAAGRDVAWPCACPHLDARLHAHCARHLNAVRPADCPPSDQRDARLSSRQVHSLPPNASSLESCTSRPHAGWAIPPSDQSSRVREDAAGGLHDIDCSHSTPAR